MSMTDLDRTNRYNKQVYTKFDDNEQHNLQNESTLDKEATSIAYLEKCMRCDGKLEDLSIDDVDNEYILTGYRLNYRGFCNTLKTMFMCHNESFNVWSHFLPMVICFNIAIYILMHYPNFNFSQTPLMEQFETQDLSLNQFIGNELSVMEDDISKSEIIFVDNYYVEQQGLSLKDSEVDREE